MEIILTDQCKSLTGSLGRGYGYSIQKRKDRFYGKRDSKGKVPYYGHWRFIVACAQLAILNAHISDILVSAKELREALTEACFSYGSSLAKAKDDEIFHASQVMDFKKRWSL